MSATHSVAAFVCRLMCVSESVCVCMCVRRKKAQRTCVGIGRKDRSGGSGDAERSSSRIRRAARYRDIARYREIRRDRENIESFREIEI